MKEIGQHRRGLPKAMLMSAAAMSLTVTAATQAEVIALSEDFEDANAAFNASLDTVAAPTTPTGANGSQVGEFLLTIDAGSGTQTKTDFATASNANPIIAIDAGITEIQSSFLFGSDHLELGSTEFVTISYFFSDDEAGSVNRQRINGGRANFNNTEATAFQAFTETIDISGVVANGAKFLRDTEIKYTAQNFPQGAADITLRAYVDDINITLVPEPGSLALATLGALFVMRRRH
jgi:hypothetical protein